MHGHAVMGEQGVQEGAELEPLWGPSVEDYHLGAARQEVQDPIAQGLKLNDDLGRYYGVEC